MPIPIFYKARGNVFHANIPPRTNYLFWLFLIHHHIPASHMCQRRDRPGDRIGQVQRKQGAMPLKYCENPDNTETAGSDQGNDHGEEGVAHSSHASHHDIHEAAEEIRGADEMHSVEAVLDDLRVGGVNAEKLLAEENEAVSEDQTNHTDKNQADT